MNEPTFNVSLTKNEIEVLLNLLDVAVKAAGRSACEAVAHFDKKFNAALTPPAAIPGEVAAIAAAKPN